MTQAEIGREHPEYRGYKELRQRYRDLYAGGAEMLSQATRYLAPRQNEPQDIYSERLSRAYYENYIGSIIDWYGTTLFRREAVLSYEGQDEGARKFFNSFAEDCDLQGTTINDFFRRQVVDALIHGKSYTVVDFPRVRARATTRAEEEAAGQSRAYLWGCGAPDLIHWQKDARGDFEWTVIRTERRLSDGADDDGWTERRWVRYDREKFQTYVQDERKGERGPVVCVDEGHHGLAPLGIVPVFEFSLGDGLWLMNKAASLQLEHFNKSNALSWALTMGLFAMPVVYSDREWRQCVGESYFIQLGPDDKFGWAEPEGHVYQIALQNIDRLREEIYRVCYLTHQAGGSLSKNSAMTGLSKQRDYVVTQEVLRGFGDRVKDGMKKVLRAIAAARRDGLLVDVQGLDEFDIGDFGSELEDAKALLALGVDSPTLKAEVTKKLALKYLCDARQELKDRVASEIDGK